MKKVRKMMVTTIAICLFCLSANTIFAISDSQNVSAQLTSLSAQAFAQGAYLTNTGGSGFQASQIASGKMTLDVNKFRQNQSRSVASKFGNKYFVAGTTGTSVGAKLYVSYKLSGKYTGSFTVSLQL